MIEIMTQVRCHLILFLLATGLFWADETRGQNRLVFPTPDRPVAPIVSSGYSDEKTRDAKGEAERVLDRLGVRPGFRVADIGTGEGYYTVRLLRRLGSSGTIYAQDVSADYLKRLEARLKREEIRGVRLVLGMPNNPKLMPNSVDVALLSHMYHEIENPYEFFYGLDPPLQPALVLRSSMLIDRPTTMEHHRRFCVASLRPLVTGRSILSRLSQPKGILRPSRLRWNCHRFQ